MTDRPAFDLHPGDYVVTLARASAGKDALSLPDQHLTARAGLDAAGYAGLPTREGYTEGQKRLAWAKRTETHRLLADITDPHCRAIGVWREDRLIASAGQSEYVYEVLESCGVELVENDGGVRILNPKSEGEELVRSIEASQSRQYVKKQRRAMYTTNRTKFLDGKHVTRPPFGTRKEVVLDSDGRPVMHGARGRVLKKQLVVDEAAMVLVRHFYEHAAAGRHLEELEAECAARGIVGPDGGVWAKQRIRKLIANPFYKGEQVWNVRETVHLPGGAWTIRRRPESQWLRGPSPLGPLVDPAVWEAANQAVTARWHVRGGGRGYRVNDPRVLDGVVYCGRCDGRMFPREQMEGNRRKGWRRTGRFSYHCNGTNSIYSTCKGRYHSISENKLFERLANYAVEVAGRPLAGEAIYVPIIRSRRDETAEIGLRKTLAKIAGKLEREKDLYSDGDRTKGEFEQRKAALLTERAQVQAQVAELSKPREERVYGPDAQEAVAALAALVPLLRDSRIPLDVRRAEACGLIARIVVDQPAPAVVEFVEDAS